ncbi:L-lactate dehydrogenase [Haloferula luteola]|uniref:L-lactate dehydrogenase n=1 Tax=Haloferula luteola TaxID=595692 RepID=A0A840UWF1_9BACT|nr:2-dehydropantoate 2-reductase N-terminal domain-containing protein [Haloferula luteola]MBB5350055.1 L-lactate dehydrogenase [Haloferula luteola]
MKVTIIGPGAVGMVLAYTLVLRAIAREVVLVGRNRAKAEGEALDLMHAQTFLEVPVKVRAGEIEDAEGSEVVVVCASVPMGKEFSNRNELLRGNVELMQALLPRLGRVAPAAKLLMVSNPVDALTWWAKELTGFPAERVMGTGTLVDSVRLRELLSETIGIHPQDLRTYILGEHGDHQFAALSVAGVGGERIDDTVERRGLFERAKFGGFEVFSKKGNTSYTVGLAAAYIVKSILMDERRTMPVSVQVKGYLGVDEVYLSLPVVIGRNGIERYLYPELNDEERQSFLRAAAAVNSAIQEIRSSCLEGVAPSPCPLG